MKKKIVIILGIVILVSLAIVGWTSQSPSPSLPTISPSPTSAVPLAQVSTAPQTIFAVDVTKTYKIVFDPNYNTYIISVLATPFDKIRLQAEQDLIKTLKLTQEAACAQLKVHIGSPHFANPNQMQSYDTFSFCSN